MSQFLTPPFLNNTSLIKHPVLSLFSTLSRPKMSSFSSSSSSTAALPDDRIVLGCGGATVDFLAAVASYPKRLSHKIRSTSFQVQGGGNAGNALTSAARLGLNPSLISKVADDAQGRGILEELEADGVDTSFFIVSPEGNSPFTYIIVADETKTHTCIHTPGYPPMLPDELSPSRLDSAPSGARLVYSDVRLHETALVIAKEEMDIDEVLESLKQKSPYHSSAPSSISSADDEEIKFGNGLGTVTGRLHMGLAEKIPPSELVDTTGAGSAFIGAVLYVCANMPPEKMLPFAASLAACGCRALGARTGLPRSSNPLLASYLEEEC